MELSTRIEMPLGDEVLVSKDAYLSRDFACLEADRLWPHVWQIACREEEVANVGDYIEYTIADQSIIIVRGENRTIKAYYNACLHRGTPLKYGCGNARELRCRYHAWRWNLDGSIKEVTDGFDFDPECMDPERLRLPECLVDTWGGFVFINMDLGAEPLLEFLGPIPRQFERFEPEKMRLSQYRTTQLATNWKTALYAFTDTYHAAGVHPQLLYYFDDTDTPYEAFDIHGRFIPREGSFGRPSPRLGEFPIQKKDVLLAWMSEFNEIALFDDDSAAALRDVVESVPEGMTSSQFIASIIRNDAGAAGIDTSPFTDSELISDGMSTWAVFPNSTMPMNALSMFYIRVRPNGLDPESCLLDIWNLRRFGEDEKVPPIERQFFEDWKEHDAWGRLLSQDLHNLPNVQRGLHSRAFKGLLCGRQDLVMWNHDRVLRQFLNEPID